jgi:predicted metal-dependent hydrolase|tara:strand:- start:23 stop:205 length:183 start_codon:yes stop_codon:yes gene_type:complete
MTTKLKNRLKKMNFQQRLNRRVEIEDKKDDKYYEEIYTNKIRELLGQKNENISNHAGGGL